MLYKEITQCRLCDGLRIAKVLDLGKQALTGIFPKSKDEEVPTGPLELCKCADCDLVQLSHNYDLGTLYGETYGYRSGLNQSMVRHLHQKIANIRARVRLSSGDLAVDIGSNDSTLLQAYPKDLTLVGVDPSGPKFKQYYPAHVRLIPDFFSAGLLERFYPGKRAKVITSIAMFYDLEHPQDFVDEIARVLDDEGVWVFEQSYLPFMLDTNSYDTVCHEHLEYYALHQIKRMLDRAELKIIDIEFNDINGGSFSVMATKKSASHAGADALVTRTLEDEQLRRLGSIETYSLLGTRIADHRVKLRSLLGDLKRQGKKVIGYGASTKGNVLIQYCGINADLIPCIAEVNPDKFGSYTPGTHIPIVSEAEARAMKPDYFLVFPWHFKSGILPREQEFLRNGGRFIFPLPKIEIISSDGSDTVWPST